MSAILEVQANIQAIIISNVTREWQEHTDMVA